LLLGAARLFRQSKLLPLNESGAACPSMLTESLLRSQVNCFPVVTVIASGCCPEFLGTGCHGNPTGKRGSPLALFRGRQTRRLYGIHEGKHHKPPAIAGNTQGEVKMSFLRFLFGKNVKAKVDDLNVNAKIDDLICKLKDPDPSVRESSTREMIALGKPAVEPLINYLKHTNEWARLMAAAALGKIGDMRAVEPLAQAINDPDEGVRNMAQTALNELQQKKIQAENAKRKSEWALKQPKCSRCGRTSDKVAEDAIRAKPGTMVIGNLVGICPACRQAFCTGHAPYDHDVDGIVCPIHKKELDIYWDNLPREDRPWRIGPKP